MTYSARRRPSLAFLAVLLLLCGLPAHCFALSEIELVSKDRAKELGITVRSQPSANNDLWVQVEFKTTGTMKGFRWADLELKQGEKRLVTAALRPQNPTPDSVLLQFYMDPAAVPNTTVTIFVYPGGRGGVGYQLKMKDFVTPAASR